MGYEVYARYRTREVESLKWKWKWELLETEVGKREVWWCSNWKWEWEHSLKWNWELKIEKKLRSEIGAGLVLETEAETGQMP
jgi:hypothetical protein